MLFVNLVFFFPWYMTLIIETFNLSQAAANDNYVKQSYYNDALDRLEKRPIFKDRASDIKIDIKNSSSYNAVGDNDENSYLGTIELDKPYRQRGEAVTVKIEAVYPLSIKLWGDKLERDVPVSFSLTTVGLKHYKDIELN